MPDLSLVPTSELLDTLMQRYDNAIFHGILSRPIEKEDKNMVYSICTTGDSIYAMGLATRLIHFLNERLDSTNNDMDASEL